MGFKRNGLKRVIPEGGGGGSIAETASHHIWMVISVSRVLQIGMDLRAAWFAEMESVGALHHAIFMFF